MMIKRRSSSTPKVHVAHGRQGGRRPQPLLPPHTYGVMISLLGAKSALAFGCRRQGGGLKGSRSHVRLLETI